MMAGYSGTALSKKLGLKPGFRMKTKSAPAGFRDLLLPLPDGVAVSPRLRGPVDIFHLFSKSRAALEKDLPQGLKEIHQDGTIWVSWPKQASGIKTDLNREVVRECGLKLILVDVKVCAVDETWSGLKFVIRKALRK